MPEETWNKHLLSKPKDFLTNHNITQPILQLLLDPKPFFFPPPLPPKGPASSAASQDSVIISRFGRQFSEKSVVDDGDEEADGFVSWGRVGLLGRGGGRFFFFFFF